MGIIKDYEKREHIFEVECDLCKGRYNSKKDFRILKYKEWKKLIHYMYEMKFGEEMEFSKELYICGNCFEKIEKNLRILAEVEK